MTAVSETVVESVRQSEVSQKEESKYRILMHMYVIWKNGTTEPICRAGTERQTQKTDNKTAAAAQHMQNLNTNSLKVKVSRSVASDSL